MMDSTNGYDPTLPVDLEGSVNPDLLTEVTFGSHLEYPDGSVPMVAKTSNGRMSPVRARTMKEYDQQIAGLKKENFSLKLRIYFLEERMQQKFGDGEDVFKTNIELKVECGSLKRELEDKHNLLKKASNAMENLSSNHQVEMAKIQAQIEKDLKDSNNGLAFQLDSAQKALEEAEEALRDRNDKIQKLQGQLDKMAAEVEVVQQKGDSAVEDLMQELKDKNNEIDNLTITNLKNQEDIDLLQQQKDHAEDELEKLEKELGRKGRDLEHLSCIVRDTTLLDSQSFLLNNHLQDAVDDQNEAIKKMEAKVRDGELKIKDKNETIGKLEDLLKSVEASRKGMEKTVEDRDNQLLKEKTKAVQRDKTIKGLNTVIETKAKEIKDLVEKLKARDNEMKTMQEEFEEAAVQRQKELDRQHEEINFLEQREASMKVQLAEQENELENLMRSLGRKEGELESFKDLLSKAQNALRQSEDAVEVVQDQLKKDLVPSRPSSAHSSPVKHYKDLLDESQRRVSEKDSVIHQLNDALRDKDKQLRTCMGIFDTPQEEVSGEMVEKLTRQLKESDRALARSLEEHAMVMAEKEKKLEELRNLLSDKEKDIDRANKMLLAAEDTIDCLEKANKEKTNNLQVATDMMRAAERALQDAKQNHSLAIAEKDSLINRLQDSIGDKEALLKETMKRAPMTTDEVMDLKKTLQTKDRTLQDMIDEKDKTLTANAECVNGLLKKLQSREAELSRMSDKHKEDITKMEQEMLKMSGDLRKLETELRRKQNELHSADNQASWSHQQSQEVLDKLRAVILDKDKTISTLLDSVQEKDKINGQLRHDLQSKDDLVEKLQMLLRQSQTGSNADLSAKLQDLQIELAVKAEALRNARRTEKDLREQIQELKQKLNGVPQGEREYHTLEKQIYYLKDKLEGQNWTPGGPSPGRSSGVSGEGSNGQQVLLQETLQAQLEELRRLNAAVQTEQHLLQSIRDKSQGSPDHSQGVDEELSAVRALRRELEDGVQHNHQMRTILERQMKGIPTRESSQENVDDLRKTLNFLKLELETSKLNNKFLQSKNDLQTRQRVDGEGRAESSHQGAQTSPVAATWSPGKKRSPSPIDANVQLNRQSLSDMSAPMLRKLIRQLQQQLNQEEKENAELRRKLSVVEDVRNIPGKNDDDENSIPYLRSEIERLESELIRKEEMIGELRARLGSLERDSSASGVTDLQNEIKKLTLQLNHTEEVISMLKQQLTLNAKSKGSDFDPELIVQMAGEIQKLKLECDKARLEGSSDTSEACSSVSAPSVVDDSSLKGRRSKKSSIPRPKTGITPVVGDISAINQPETLKKLLMESKKRITDLEDKLKATEGTVRYQTQKMKYYKGLLEDNGLIQRSPMCSRSSSESNLAALTSKIPIRKHAVSQENLPSLVGSMDSAIGSDYGVGMDTVFEKFGKTDDKETLKDQVTQLRELLVQQSRDIKALRERLEKEKQQHSTDRLDQNAQTIHSLDDTLVSRDTLQDLYQQMESLQRNLQETQDTNAELQHKLLQLQNNNTDTCTLKQKLKDSQAKIDTLEEKVAAFKNSSVHEILEAQKAELAMLRKKLSDTQNSCSQLNYWLEEVSSFLTELVYVDQDGDDNQVRGMKHKVDMSKTIVRNMSTCILDSFDTTYDMTSDQPQTDESKGLVAENEALRRSESNLTEFLRQKNLEVEKLTNELRKKNLLVDQLHQEVLHFHQINRKSESPKSSSTVSSADGNVTPSGKMSKGKQELTKRSPNNSLISEQVSQVSTLRSPERARHMTGSSLTDSSHLRLDRTQDGLMIVEDVADSSQGSTGYHSSHLSGDDFMPGAARLNNTTGSDKENSTLYVSAFDTDEKLLYNRRLADGQMFDNTLTPPVFKLNGDTSLSTKIPNSTAGRHVEFSVLDKSEREEVEVETLRARLNAVEDLNKTLKDELNAYENLCTSIGVQNSPQKISPCSKSKEENDTELLRQHLAEIRALRIKLEHSVKDSDRLRHQLELDMDGHKVSTDFTQNVYMYSKQQTTITKLQQTVQQLQQQLKENQSTLRDKIITVQEREWTIQKLQQELSDTKQKYHRSADIKTQSPEKDISIREWHENIRSQEQTCVVQQRRIEQQDNLLEQLRKKLQLQEHSLHQQETKLKELYESGQQKDQVMHDKDNMILRRGEQVVQLEQSSERLEKKISLFEDSIKKLEEQVEQKESCIKTMKEELQKQENTIQHQGDVVKQREKMIRKLKEEVQKKVDIIKQQGETITDKETAMKSLSRMVKEQAEHLRNKDNTLQKYDKEVRSLNEKVKQLDQLKAEKDEANNRLVQRNDILDQDNCKLVKRNEELDSQLKHSNKEVDRLEQELETMLVKVQENRDLNKTLKLELSVYEKLQDEDSSSKPLGGFDIRELLTEIRHLRVQLERCIDTNNALRQKLEEHLLHQASPRHITTTTTNIFTVKDGSPTRSNGTDVPDGQPNPERPSVNGALTIRRVQNHQVPVGSRSASGSYVSSSSDTMSVSCPSDTPSLSGFGMSTWPPISSENVMFSQQRELCVSQSSPGGTLHQSLVDLAKFGHNSRPVMSEGNLSYYVDDPPSSVADLTGFKVDSDLRCLFAVGKLDDFEKLKKENCESLTVLKGIEARIKDRLRVFKTMPTSESVEYSTLKELSLSSENLRICLDEEKSLIGCFWTTQLPKGGSDTKVTGENNHLRAELFAMQSKYDLMVKMVRDAEARLHTSNEQKQNMEEIIHRQLKKTSKVVSKAKTNFEKEVPRNRSDQLVSTRRGQQLRIVDTDRELSYS